MTDFGKSWRKILSSACKIVHRVVNTEDIAEKPVEETGWEDSLPESDEMETPGDSPEINVFLNCPENFL